MKKWKAKIFFILLMIFIASKSLFASASLKSTNISPTINQQTTNNMDFHQLTALAQLGRYQANHRYHHYSRRHQHIQYNHHRHNTEFYGRHSINLTDNQFQNMAYRRSSGRKVFVFDPRRLKWFAYDRSGGLVASGRASGGRGYCPDIGRSCRTPVGTFSVHHKGNAYCKSSKYPVGRGGAPMPNCMYFKGGYAIHGSPDVPNYNASHGCIRVLPSAARWLNNNFVDYGTTVIVRPY